MELNKTGDILDLKIDELFEDKPEAGTPPAKEEPKIDLTEAMSKRINEVRAKTEQETRDKLAKDLGFESYEALHAAKTKQTITEAGLDPEQVEKIIEPLLAKRLESDPRIQKLQQLEEQEKKAAIKAELDQLEKLTGLKLTEADLPKETMDLHAKGVPLAQAYIATNPSKILSANVKGSTNHLATGSGGTQVKLRNLNQAEKDFYKSINPYITDEELNKKTIEVK